MVEVVTAPPAVDKTDAKTASNYRLDRMDLLPVGRDMESLALLTPGVVDGVGGGVQVRGAMTSNNKILVDGQNVEDGCYGNRGVSLIEDAIEETQVLTGALSAEYGGVDGGVINAITRSGSNTFTGQVRWNFSNPAWNAVGPMIDSSAIQDRTAFDTTFSLGGYLVKDRLWFHASRFHETWQEVRTIGSDAFSDPDWPGGAGAAYTYVREEVRRQLKLTWLLNQEHTLVGSYMDSDTTENQRDIWAGSLETLTPKCGNDKVLSLSWRALWSPQFLTDIRYGVKRELLRPGTTGNSGVKEDSPILDTDTYYYYNHSPFNGDDGGDHRDNRTLAAKGSLFLGGHQIDVGFDEYLGIRRAPAGISSTGYVFNVTAIDPLAETATPESVSVITPGTGSGRVTNRGWYLNDKWVLDERLSLQLGLRWESFEGENETGAKLAGSAALSPRLGLKYDFRGDATWIGGASYARYNTKVLDQLLMKGTFQDNPMSLDFNAIDTTPAQPFSSIGIFNLSNYNYSAAGVSYAYLPGVNIKMNPAMRAPTVDEYQASLAYSYRDRALGTGYLRGTVVHKTWKNLVDYRIGNDGKASYMVTLPPLTGADSFEIKPYIYYWDNNPDATRDYKGLELEFATAKGRWQFQGNLTWSRLWGNYEGEEDMMPGRGEGIHAWETNEDGVVMFDRHLTAPDGYLRGHVPFRARLLGTCKLDSALGETTLGLLYRYDAGSAESETRYISGEDLNAGLPDEARNTWFIQYKDNRRGTNRGHSSWYLDLSVHHEWQLFRARSVPVRAFLKAVIKNVLNHKQLLRTPKSYEAANGSHTSDWVPDAGYGVPGPDCYGEPRTYSFSAGLRF